MKKIFAGIIIALFVLGGCTDYEETKSDKPETVELATSDTDETRLKGCLIAIEASEEVAGYTSDFTDVTKGYIDLIPKAYEAGVLQEDGQDIIDKMEGLTNENNELNKKVSKAVEKFNAAKKVCRL